MKAPQRPRLALLKRYAIDVLGLPYTTARDAAMRGEFEIVRLGRSIYVEVDAIERWIDSRRERVA